MASAFVSKAAATSEPEGLVGPTTAGDDVDERCIEPAFVEPSVRPVIEFCGQYTEVTGSSFVIGRRGDLVIGEGNAFVHRKFLLLRHEYDRWFLINVGSGMSASVTTGGSANHAVLGPGASLAINSAHNVVRFVAGPTRYEFEIQVPNPVSVATAPASTGDHTKGRVPLTEDQRLLIVVLAEQVLRTGASPYTSIPTSMSAAAKLGWRITKFNRKLDNVCQKLERVGVRGLHGGSGSLASQRRIRLVEHSVAARLVTTDDLVLLDQAAAAARSRIG